MTLNKSPKKILLLSANPRDTIRLRVDQELREIEEVLQNSINRDRFQLIPKTAVRTRDLQQIMLHNQPHIVHFSGHGQGNQGLVFEDIQGITKIVSTKALADLFGLFVSSVECVVLNACYSVEQARAIADHVDYVVGMKQELGDQAAIAYSQGFYRA
ncbi:CHAT domain protein [Lyngbya aestuarii BL J]|uniref:CHAT domain protein n=1 Tax=Lyngbya aestuarii BL J TaxID=1348334 RepID=U7QHU6_9CYAN|nr:CHAT domain-containing protein [Lyngbya aestuarii]ERT05991.1 CHAT domain protein [Lyngbya aestuarii BL J]